VLPELPSRRSYVPGLFAAHLPHERIGGLDRAAQDGTLLTCPRALMGFGQPSSSSQVAPRRFRPVAAGRRSHRDCARAQKFVSALGVLRSYGKPGAVALQSSMRPVKAQCGQRIPKATQPRPVTSGGRARVMVVGRSDPRRWNLAKLPLAYASEDLALAKASVSGWDHSIDSD
jgi:hypothetical protein